MAGKKQATHMFYGYFIYCSKGLKLTSDTFLVYSSQELKSLRRWSYKIL